MKTVPVSVARERISEGALLGTSKTRRAANLFRSLVALMLAGAAVLGHMSPAHAAQPVAPFGIPCDSVGVSGIPYVPGVNCRLMAVDGYTRHYVVWVPFSGVPANAPAVIMQHGAAARRAVPAHVRLARKGDAGTFRRNLSNGG